VAVCIIHVWHAPREMCIPARVPEVCVPWPSASFMSPLSATYSTTFLWLELAKACSYKGPKLHEVSKQVSLIKHPP